MSIIVLTAHRATFIDMGNGYRSFSYKPFDRPVLRREVEATRMVEMIPEWNRFIEDAKATGEHFRAIALVRDGRAPQGFNKANLRLDWEQVPEQAAA